MSWRDEDIDKLFQDNAANSSVEYKNAYWKEFEAASLPINKGKKDFLWIGTALMFLGVVTTIAIYNPNDSLNDMNDVVFASSNDSAPNSRDRNTNVSERSQVLKHTNGVVSDDAIEGITEQSEFGNRISESGSYNGENGSSASTNNPGVSTPTVVPMHTGSGSDLSSEPTSVSSNPRVRPYLVNEKSVSELVVNTLALRPFFASYSPEQAAALSLSIPPIDLRAATLFYFELNGGFSESIVSPSDQYSNSFGAGVGVEIQKNRFNFTAGVNGNISNHKDIQLSRESKVYGFGSELISTELNYSEIYSLEGNLSVGYSFGKHVLSLGVRPSFVVGSKVRDRRVINEILVHDIQGYGYMDGLKRFGLKPQIGYAYKCKRGFTLGANLGIQTQEALNEDYINGENNRFPLDGQIYFRKSIRLKK